VHNPRDKGFRVLSRSPVHAGTWIEKVAVVVQQQEEAKSYFD